MSNAPDSFLDRFERALPRGLAARLALARRDAAMVLGGLAGRTPPPLVRSARRAIAAAPVTERAATLTHGARSVRVREVTRETDDAVSITFEDPTGRAFEYQPGQFFTVKVAVDGVTLRRAYSASGSSARGSTLRITVKRVSGGAMSTWLTTRAAAGDTLDLLGPSGSFTLAPSSAPRHLALVGGGSGITPLYSIACAVLRDEPESRVTLVYGNRRLGDVIFARELDELTREHGARFEVIHALEEAHEGFDGLVGRLDEATAGRALDRFGWSASTEFMLCGPAPMREAVRNALDARGVAASSVREEVYTSPHSTVAENGEHVVTLRGRGAVRAFKVRGAETILEGAMREGVDMPFSCTVGGCGACACKRVEGEVSMDEPNCLTETERVSGAVLTCVGRARGAVTLEVP